MSETKGYLDIELLRFTTAGSVDDEDEPESTSISG